jgi:TonB family protein
MWRFSRVAILIAACGGFLWALADAQSGEPMIMVGPTIFRAQARNAVLPEYPQSSREAGHAGRVTAEVDTTKDGRVTNVRILEAPDDAMAASVRSALSRWTFEPFRRAEDRAALATRSRLIFYFRISDGRATVVDGVLESQSSAEPKKPPDRR